MGSVTAEISDAVSDGNKLNGIRSNSINLMILIGKSTVTPEQKEDMVGVISRNIAELRGIMAKYDGKSGLANQVYEGIQEVAKGRPDPNLYKTLFPEG